MSKGVPQGLINDFRYFHVNLNFIFSDWASKMHARFALPPNVLSQMFMPNLNVPVTCIANPSTSIAAADIAERTVDEKKRLLLKTVAPKGS